MGELINEFLPVKEKVHIIAEMKEMGKDMWRTPKESDRYQSFFAQPQGDGSQITKFAAELGQDGR